MSLPGRDEPIAVPLQLPSSLHAEAAFAKGAACTLVILGALGDLTTRKLVPALAHLHADDLLDDAFRIIGVARRDLDDAAFRDLMREAVRTSEHTAALAGESWREFADRLSYVRGDLRDDALYARLEEKLAGLEDTGAPGNRLFYFAVPPDVYGAAARRLADSGLAPRRVTPDEQPWSRLIIEKPFGTSEDSARALNRALAETFEERQIYRIDHFLGKETVQNLLVFRFANSIFEPVWNRAHIHHVQITAAETVGVEHRAGFYEDAGVVRDMFQNHLLQLLCLTAMEPPATFRADAVRDEKTKVLDAIRPFDRQRIETHAVRGQYGAGTIEGARVPSYREEPDVDPASTTPTWAALRVLIDNWRWQGVPFFLRSGKRMARRLTEIAIRFRHPPHLMFPARSGRGIQPNLLTFHIQPEEGISLCMEVKVPGMGVRIASARMDLSYAEAFGDHRHSAYETLLLDAMQGDQTLFARSDAVEAAWRVVDPVIAVWEAEPGSIPFYAAGSWGPDSADALIAGDGARWRRPA